MNLEKNDIETLKELRDEMGHAHEIPMSPEVAKLTIQLLDQIEHAYLNGDSEVSFKLEGNTPLEHILAIFRERGEERDDEDYVFSIHTQDVLQWIDEYEQKDQNKLLRLMRQYFEKMPLATIKDYFTQLVGHRFEANLYEMYAEQIGAGLDGEDD